MRGKWIWAARIGGLFLLAAIASTAPFSGAWGLAEILAWAFYLSAFAIPSPCRSGAAYPFRHGFRAGACSVAPRDAADQSEGGTTSA